MFVSTVGLEVRAATERDLARIVELDHLAFATAGMGLFAEDHVRCWMEVNPQGLLVASKNSTAVAYCYTQCVHFSPADLSHLTTDIAFSDGSFTRATHRPEGNATHVVTVSSVMPGGRRALFEGLMHRVAARKHDLILLFSRIPGFRAYRKTLNELDIDLRPFSLERIARFYVYQCAERFGGQLWPTLERETLPLPAPGVPDPVLNKYLRDRGAAVRAVLPKWIRDPASSDFAVLVVISDPRP